MEIIIAFIFSIVGAFGTYRLQKFPNVSATRASAFMSVAVWGIITILSRGQLPEDLVNTIVAATFGGSFVGMSSMERFNTPQILTAGIIFFFLMTFVLSQYPGFGGGYGFSAFVACMIVLMLKKLKPA